MLDNRPHKITLLAGATAVGKSTLALQLAQRHNGIIINADSVQCYHNVTILSAQPDTHTRAQVPHYLYSFAHDACVLNLSQWLQAVAELLRTYDNKHIIIVGGTGLYFYALQHGLVNIPPIDTHIQQQVRALSTEDAHHALCQEDIVMAQRLMPQDAQRIKRALEVIRSTKHSLYDWQRNTPAGLLQHYTWHGIILERTRVDLYHRINQRFVQMVQQGALNEVCAISCSNSPLWRTLGARALQRYITQQCSLNEAIAQGQQESRQYAKRQITRFRSFDERWHRQILA